MLLNMGSSSSLQERKGRREATAAAESDEELAALERRRPASETPSASPSSSSSSRRESQSRRQLFLRALAFLAQLLLELGRRALRCVERTAPRYVALGDRLLVRAARGRSRARRLALALLLLLALAAPLQLFRMQFGSGGGGADVACVPLLLLLTISLSKDKDADATVRECGGDDSSGRGLSEARIRPHIIVDRHEASAPSPVPLETKRRAFLRAGGDGLQTDDTSLSCENTVQGVAFVTDSLGVALVLGIRPSVCKR